MYKLLKDSRGGDNNTVLRLADSTSVPFDPANTDYQAYLKFLEEGGQPLPAEDDGQAAE
jgi:hypothetical protein